MTKFLQRHLESGVRHEWPGGAGQETRVFRVVRQSWHGGGTEPACASPDSKRRMRGDACVRRRAVARPNPPPRSRRLVKRVRLAARLARDWCLAYAIKVMTGWSVLGGTLRPATPNSGDGPA